MSNYAKHYAQALFELRLGKSDLPNVRAALARRGHLKLLPMIFTEYQKLVVQKERSAMHAKVTPERERNRVLLELYRTLVDSKATPL